MYIQLTTYCNMECPHCCFECGGANNKHALHMTPETFSKSLDLAHELGEDMITLGGGEPTSAKYFYQIIRLIREQINIDPNKFCFLMYTNGKNATRAKYLLNLIDNKEDLDFIDVRLSRDEYHAPISEKIEKEFVRRYKIKPVLFLSPQGRAKNILGRPPNNEDCACPTIFVSPEGNVWACGCKLHSLGTVWRFDNDMYSYLTQIHDVKSNSYSDTNCSRDLEIIMEECPIQI